MSSGYTADTMIKEIAFLLRHGPGIGRKQTTMGKVEFQNWLTDGLTIACAGRTIRFN